MIIPRCLHVPKMRRGGRAIVRSDGQVLLYDLIGELGNAAGNDQPPLIENADVAGHPACEGQFLLHELRPAPRRRMITSPIS
jgi:hypothetical protein